MPVVSDEVWDRRLRGDRGRACVCIRIYAVETVLFERFPDLPRSISTSSDYHPREVCKPLTNKSSTEYIRMQTHGLPRSPRRIRHRMNSVAHVKRSGDFLECAEFGATGDVVQACCLAASCRLYTGCASFLFASCLVAGLQGRPLQVAGCKVVQAVWLQGCKLQAGKHRLRLRRCRCHWPGAQRPHRQQAEMGGLDPVVA
jgi:hypothetical protein